MTRLSIALLFFVSSFTSLPGQSPYELTTNKELLLIGAGMSSFLTGEILKSQVDPLELSEIQELESEGLNSFERWVTTQSDRRSDDASDYLLYAAQVAPVAVALADRSHRNDILNIAVLYGETALLNYGLTILVKNSVRRTRPFVYNEDVADEFKMTRSARQSYFSGHTSQSAAMTFFAAKIYSDYHPESRWRILVWSAAAAVPAAAGILRMTSGKHFPLDVMTGYVVGGTLGVAIPHLHKKNRKKRKTDLSLMPTGNGALMVLRF